MSWSIYLSGRKEFVQSELDQAIHILSQTKQALEDTYHQDVQVSVSGSFVPGSTTGWCGASYSVTGITPEAVLTGSAEEVLVGADPDAAV